MDGASRLERVGLPRILLFVAGIGMVVSSLLTMQHFFAANYPESIFEGSFCDISAFFNCNSSAYARIAAVAGVPIGLFGAMLGGLVALSSVFPSRGLERAGGALAALNLLGVIALLGYSVLVLGSLCLLCSGYYVFSALAAWTYWNYAGAAAARRAWATHPSIAHLLAFGVVTAGAALGVRLYHEARRAAQTGGVATRVVNQYFSLPTVPAPSFLSPFWKVRSTERFEDAPIQLVEYAVLLCPDCRYLNAQLDTLAGEFEGKINIVFQFFPLEAKCNDVVEKDLHPGACDVTWMAAYDTATFRAVHDEVFANFRAARTPEWRADLARRYGVEVALQDSATHALVDRIIRTGAEYEKTSDRYANGIRSTPTMILNNRMIIGTFPYEQLRAIFQALVDAHERGEGTFMENWVERGRSGSGSARAPRGESAREERAPSAR